MKISISPSILIGILASTLIIVALPAAAWSNHALGTWQALSSLFAAGKTPAVSVESLESFLIAQGHTLESLLQQEEQWARTNVPEYPQRPSNLSYRYSTDAKQIRQRFMAALRINPQSKLPLYLQMQPGADVSGKTLLAWNAVTTLQHSLSVMNGQFLRVKEGDMLAALDVVASASDEPDYGLDLGLWDNNGNARSLGYQFGKQAFGNPALEYSSQAPFHMGFFHESPIVYKAAGFLRRTYPEYRIHLYQTLSRHAFNTGHAYWGWRFAGWALHYVQDLTQPYHTSVLPGVSVARMLWINALDMAGAHGSKQNVITLVSNRHAALENYQYYRMHTAYLRNDKEDALLRATRENVKPTTLPYSPSQVRQGISLESHALANATDAVLEHVLPTKYISDPLYVLGETEPDLNLFAVMSQQTVSQQTLMTDATVSLMRNFGTHTRAFILATVALQPIAK
ncbi:MAG: hypothetical protein V4447_01890 [Pseudomonadota bacterium]